MVVMMMFYGRKHQLIIDLGILKYNYQKTRVRQLLAWRLAHPPARIRSSARNVT